MMGNPLTTELHGVGTEEHGEENEGVICLRRHLLRVIQLETWRPKSEVRRKTHFLLPTSDFRLLNDY